MCDCAFCTSSAETTLPVRVLFTCGGHARWAWCTGVSPTRFRLWCKGAPVNFASVSAVATHLFGNAATEVWVRTDDGVAAFDGQNFRGTTFSIGSLSPAWRRAVARYGDQEFVCRRMKRTKRARLEHDDSDDDGDLSYPSSELGGSVEDVAFVLHARPAWDEETVIALLEAGATPRLLCVGDVYRGGRFPKVKCTFVQPNGVKVPGVWLPLGFAKACYPKECAHLIL